MNCSECEYCERWGSTLICRLTYSPIQTFKNCPKEDYYAS